MLTHRTLTLLSFLWLTPAALALQSIQRVSYDPLTGQEGFGTSAFPSISDDGQVVAWEMNNFGANDGAVDIWIRDFAAGTTTQFTGNPGSGHSRGPSLSPNGQHISFTSSAFNITGQCCNTAHIMYGNVGSGFMELVTVGSNFGNANSEINADGTQIVFESIGDFPGIMDSNNWVDVYVRDRTTGVTTMLSQTAAGGDAGNGASSDASVSSSGRWVAFASSSDDLGPVDTNGRTDIFVIDRDPDMNGIFDEGNSVTTLMSKSTAGVQGDHHSRAPDISGDGRFVAFASNANNLSSEPGSNAKVFLRDRDPDQNGIFDEGNGTLVRVDTDMHGSGGNPQISVAPKISTNGSRVAFTTGGNFYFSGDNTYQAFLYDVATRVNYFVSEREVGGLPNGNSGMANSSAGGLAIDGDGDRIVFGSGATDLIAMPADTNVAIDLYMRDMCAGAGCEIGTPYCVATNNSTGQPGRLRALGSEWADANTVLLRADQLPANKAGIFIMSASQDNVPNVGGGQGTLCVGAPLLRIELVFTDANGEASLAPNLDAMPTGFDVLPGSTWNFQYWFRDLNPGNTSNLTNGLEIQFD